MAYQLPPLPYAADALEPVISRETIEYHYGKHHQTYVNNLNNLIKDTPMENLTLEEIVLRSSGAIFNNAAQVFNHNFYWNCLTPNGKGQPSGPLAEAICQQWGDFAKFKEEFSKAAISLFGSGWTWLVKDEEEKLFIVNTSNAETPILQGKKPLLTFDVWEHAYYIDYRNARAAYVEKLWNIINWDFVEANFTK